MVHQQPAVVAVQNFELTEVAIGEFAKLFEAINGITLTKETLDLQYERAKRK